VSAVAFGALLLLGLVPKVRVPAAVLEIVAGIVLGPSVLGWVEIDQAISVLALIGLALDVLSEGTAAMIAAGLVSVVVFSIAAVSLLGGSRKRAPRG
jgi:Kef-type K+ transport system membrane component KefB